MAPQAQSEKKIIADKVAKVREVVDNATTNDIVMVLHSFDLDVNKTIQAFCEDGAASILGDWVTSSGVSVAAAKKKKNKKSKAKNGATIQATPPTEEVPKTETKENVTVNTNKSADKPVKNNVEKKELTDPLSIAFKEIRVALNNREKELRESKPSASFDTSAILKAISALGTSQKPIANGKPNGTASNAKASTQSSTPAPTLTQIKHATSQSSITSSVGADSGVNLSPTHKEEKKPAKQQTIVNDGGIQMTSEGLSADQLAALQQTLKLQLAARGLDASVLTSSENISRRRTPKGDGKKGGNQNQAKKVQPKLSIL